MTPIYYKGASAVCLVYDSTSQESFEGLQYWVDELQQQANAGQLILCVVASKVDDTEHEEVTIKKATEYSKSIGAQMYQTSSKDGTGIQNLFTAISERLHLASLAKGIEVSTPHLADLNSG